VHDPAVRTNVSREVVTGWYTVFDLRAAGAAEIHSAGGMFRLGDII